MIFSKNCLKSLRFLSKFQIFNQKYINSVDYLYLHRVEEPQAKLILDHSTICWFFPVFVFPSMVLKSEFIIENFQKYPLFQKNQVSMWFSKNCIFKNIYLSLCFRLLVSLRVWSHFYWLLFEIFYFFSLFSEYLFSLLSLYHYWKKSVFRFHVAQESVQSEGDQTPLKCWTRKSVRPGWEDIHPRDPIDRLVILFDHPLYLGQKSLSLTFRVWISKSARNRKLLTQRNAYQGSAKYDRKIWPAKYDRWNPRNCLDLKDWSHRLWLIGYDSAYEA